MLKFNDNNINGWCHSDSNIIKVYRNDAILYYRVSLNGNQEPCYAVVNDISQYQDTEFIDVFNNADGKWYKLNNLNQYEVYGAYGSGRNITYYDGKLTIDDGYEYQYSGGSWVNVGEVSGSSYVEYIETPTSSPYAGLELLTTPSSTGTPMYYEVDFMLTDSRTRDQAIIGQPSERESVSYQFKCCAYSSPYYDVGGYRLQTNWNAIGGSGNRCNIGIGVYSGDSKTEIRNLTTDTRVTSSDRSPVNVLLPVLCAARYNTNTVGDCSAVQGRSSGLRYYGVKVYDNYVLVGNYIPAKNPSTNEYTLLETISQQYCSKIGTGTMLGSETSTTVYPVYYTEKQDPPDNVVFSTMEEAEAYECPYVGMHATIAGESYVFAEIAGTYYWQAV